MTTEAGAQGASEAADKAALLSPDDEKEARKQGWIPEDEWDDSKGRRPGKFKTAREFLDDGEAMSPHMKRLLDAQKRDFEDRLGRIERVNGKTTEALLRQHQKDIAELKAERKDAIKAGDDKLADQLDARIEKMRDNAPGDTDKATDEADSEAEAAFVTRNADWYGEDATLTNFAEATSRRIAKEYFDKHGKQMPYADNLKQVETKVKASADYKTRFGGDGKAANGHAAVDGGGEAAGPMRGDPLARFPNEVRSQCSSDMKKFPKLYPTKQSWLEVFESK